MDREQTVNPRARNRVREDYPFPELNPYVEAHRALPNVVPASEAPGWKGRWASLYGNDAPLHLEVGSGNGFYLAGMARAHPELNWLGLEIRFKRVVLAATKLERAGLANGRLTRWDAFRLDELFAAGSLAGIHVNHPDPWPKRKQTWRRLIARPFAESAVSLLAPGGELRLKTDFPPHVDALLDAVAGLPLTVVGRSADIRAHGAPWPDEITTNYQRKFDERGVPVVGVWLRREGARGC